MYHMIGTSLAKPGELLLLDGEWTLEASALARVVRGSIAMGAVGSHPQGRMRNVLMIWVFP